MKNVITSQKFLEVRLLYVLSSFFKPQMPISVFWGYF